MVWAKSHKMGCGIAYCTNPVGYYSSNIYLFVCNYAPGPPKNINFVRPYELGNPCSECGDSFPECKPKYPLTKEDEGYNLCCEILVQFSLSLSLSCCVYCLSYNMIIQIIQKVCA